MYAGKAASDAVVGAAAWFHTHPCCEAKPSLRLHAPRELKSCWSEKSVFADLVHVERVKFKPMDVSIGLIYRAFVGGEISYSEYIILKWASINANRTRPL